MLILLAELEVVVVVTVAPGAWVATMGAGSAFASAGVGCEAALESNVLRRSASSSVAEGALFFLARFRRMWAGRSVIRASI